MGNSGFPQIPVAGTPVQYPFQKMSALPQAGLCLPPACQPFWSGIQGTTQGPTGRVKREGQGITAKLSSNPYTVTNLLGYIEKVV